MVWLVAAGYGMAAGRLEQVIENVRQNESLYTNIEVRIREDYLKYGELLQKPSISGVKEAKGYGLTTRYVAQDGMFRLEQAGNESYGGGTRESVADVRAFDGTVTRLSQQKAIGNIIAGRQEAHGLSGRTCFFCVTM